MECPELCHGNGRCVVRAVVSSLLFFFFFLLQNFFADIFYFFPLPFFLLRLVTASVTLVSLVSAVKPSSVQEDAVVMERV